MDINLVIVVTSLLAMLALGIWSGRGTKTIREFAVDNGNVSAAALFATIVATYVGGVQGLAEKTFTVGIIFPLLCGVGGCIQLLTVGILIAPRMERFLGSAISPGGMSYIFWGRAGEIITGVAGVLCSLGSVAVQVCAIGFLFQGCLGISYFGGVTLGCGVFILYSAFGGIRAVLVTDSIQFLGVVVAVPVLAYLAVMNAGGLDTILNTVPEKHLSLVSLWEQPLKYVPVLITWILWMLNPAWIQRLLMGRGVSQLRVAFCFSAVVCFSIILCPICIGFSALATSPNIDPNIAVMYVIQTAAPAGLQGLIIAGLLAVIMSTVDSDLNITSVMMICDVVVPCKKRVLTDGQILRYARYGSFGLGLASIVVALYFRNIIDVILYFDSFWIGTVVIPLIASVFGYKSTQQAFIWAAGIGVLTILLWTVFRLEARFNIYGLFPSMVINATVFFGLNEYGRRCGVFEREEKARQAKREKILAEREQMHRLGHHYLPEEDLEPLH
ncbi:MAG: sodium:solute symporter family protein [Holosporales bacterium]|jgi:SSS family solute:Na+ symporter|nr:sodium:solute symporter family protein [Holosporales bacterium]